MKEWVFIIFTVSLAGGIINLLAAGGVGEKHIRLLCGIICIYVTIVPVRQLFAGFEKGNIPEISETVFLPDGNEYLKEKTEEQIREYICTYLGKEGIICRLVSIDMEVTDTETVIGNIVVSVDENDVFKAREMLSGIAEVISDG